MFVAVGTGATIVVSSDGISWESVESSIPPPNTDDTLRDIAWTGSQFAVVGEINSMPGILLSPDGVLWHAASSPPDFDLDLHDIIKAGDELLAVGSHRTVARSENGEEWTAPHWGDGSYVFLGVAWSGTEFLAVGHRAGEEAIYGFGEPGAWHQSDANLEGVVQLVSAAWAGTSFLAIGRLEDWLEDWQSNILIYPSACGWGWTVSKYDVMFDLNSILWDGITAIAVGNEGSIFTSEDLDNWAMRNSGTDANLYGIASSDDMIIVVGDNGVIITSQ
jgi:hypothetical protein